MEMIVTFIFVFVILIQKYNGGSKDGLITCGTIAVTLFVMITLSANVSGACLNPAVGISILSVTGSSTLYHVYILGPLLGGAMAGVVYRFA